MLKVTFDTMESMRFMAPVLLLSLLICTGCVEIEVQTVIKENGSGTQRWKFVGTALMASEIKKQVERNNFFGKGVITDGYKEGDYFLEANLPFRDVNELRDADRDVRFESQGVILKTYNYTEVWKRSGQVTGLLGQHAGGLVPVTMGISVELPGKIVETNADVFDGSVARWSIPVTDLVSRKILSAKSRSWNWLVIIPAAACAALIVISLFAVVYKTAAKSAGSTVPAFRCSACGASVPSGSAFCSFCGLPLK